jgi:hypothetical protein
MAVRFEDMMRELFTSKERATATPLGSMDRYLAFHVRRELSQSPLDLMRR